MNDVFCLYLLLRLFCVIVVGVRESATMRLNTTRDNTTVIVMYCQQGTIWCRQKRKQHWVTVYIICVALKPTEWFKNLNGIAHWNVLIAIFSFTTHALHLTEFFQSRRKIWEMLGSLIRYLFQHTFLTKDRLKLSIRCVELWRKTAQRMWGFSK